MYSNLKIDSDSMYGMRHLHFYISPQALSALREVVPTRSSATERPAPSRATNPRISNLPNRRTRRRRRTRSRTATTRPWCPAVPRPLLPSPEDSASVPAWQEMRGSWVACSQRISWSKYSQNDSRWGSSALGKYKKKWRFNVDAEVNIETLEINLLYHLYV